MDHRQRGHRARGLEATWSQGTQTRGRIRGYAYHGRIKRNASPGSIRENVPHGSIKGNASHRSIRGNTSLGIIRGNDYHKRLCLGTFHQRQNTQNLKNINQRQKVIQPSKAKLQWQGWKSIQSTHICLQWHDSYIELRFFSQNYMIS